MAVAKYMRLTPPEGYSVSEVERIIENSEEKNAGDEEVSGKNSEDPEQEEKVTPVNIIAVMNESWFDYRTIGDPKTSESYMPFLDSLTDNIIKGYTLTCTKGGGTAKTEYEFLTGNSCQLLYPQSVFPCHDAEGSGISGDCHASQQGDQLEADDGVPFPGF